MPAGNHGAFNGGDEIKKATRGRTIFMHYALGYDALLYIMTHYDALYRGYVNQLRRKSFHELCMRALSLSGLLLNFSWHNLDSKKSGQSTIEIEATRGAIVSSFISRFRFISVIAEPVRIKRGKSSLSLSLSLCLIEDLHG